MQLVMLWSIPVPSAWNALINFLWAFNAYRANSLSNSCWLSSNSDYPAIAICLLHYHQWSLVQFTLGTTIHQGWIKVTSFKNEGSDSCHSPICMYAFTCISDDANLTHHHLPHCSPGYCSTNWFSLGFSWVRTEDRFCTLLTKQGSGSAGLSKR